MTLIIVHSIVHTIVHTTLPIGTHGVTTLGTMEDTIAHGTIADTTIHGTTAVIGEDITEIIGDGTTHGTITTITTDGTSHLTITTEVHLTLQEILPEVTPTDTMVCAHEQNHTVPLT